MTCATFFGGKIAVVFIWQSFKKCLRTGFDKISKAYGLAAENMS